MIKEYREWFGYVVLSLVMFTAEFYFSPLFSILFLISPLPFMLLQYRFGTHAAVMGAIIAALSIYLPDVFGQGIASAGSPALLIPVLLFLVMFAFTGMMFGKLAKTEKIATDWFLHAILASLCAKLFLVAVLTNMLGANPFALDESSAVAIVSAVDTGAVLGKAVDVKAYVHELALTMKMLMPSMIICYSALDSFCSYKLAAKFLKRKEIQLPAFAPFGEWRFPKELAFPILASLLLEFAGNFLPQQRVIQIISINLMMILRVLFTIEGMSVCWELMGRSKIFKKLRVPLMIFSILFIALLTYIYSIIGIIDIWYDLRKRGGKKDESNSETGR